MTSQDSAALNELYTPDSETSEDRDVEPPEIEVLLDDASFAYCNWL